MGLLLHCHSNRVQAEGEEDGSLTNDCDPDQLITRPLEVEGDPVTALLYEDVKMHVCEGGVQ